LEGIGAQLRTESEYTKVVNVIAGGPAAKSGLIKAEDKIIGVGQGDSGEIEDVIGWRIDDVVAKIRGKKGTAVRLLVVRGELGEVKPDTIMLTREKVKLEEQAAKKAGETA
ncbi:MAG: PDZ domain-containing protein, partial [Candidatus Moranbacteria bacterium]|nr:PDZ domain-containing protein [Candidatus Moranbacteria bacterium]